MQMKRDSSEGFWRGRAIVGGEVGVGGGGDGLENRDGGGGEKVMMSLTGGVSR